MLCGIFGTDAVVTGPHDIDGFRFVHGHELQMDLSAAAKLVGRTAVPVYVTAKRLGLELGRPTTNAALAMAHRSLAHEYVVFGHTHHAELGATHANTGSFLRSGRRTFLEVVYPFIKLWEAIDV